MIWGLLIIIISLFPCVYAWIYFRKQKATCQKYPFFLLRDKIILAIAKAEKHESLMETYDLINFIAARLKVSTFGVKFFVDVMAEKLSCLIERDYQLALKSPMHEIERIELNPFEEELAKLLLAAARANNYLLRISMTKIGFRILLLLITVKGFYQIAKRHPYIVNNFFARYTKGILKYSFLSQAIKNPTIS